MSRYSPEKKKPTATMTVNQPAFLLLSCWMAAIGLIPALGSPVSESHVFPLTFMNMSHMSSPCREFPHILHIDIKASGPFPQRFVLYRKDVINTNVPVYVISYSIDGDVYYERIESNQEETAAYQNTDHGAAFMARCTEQRFTIAGTMYVEGLKYRVGQFSAVTSSGEMTSDYEFALVSETFHNDNQLLGNDTAPMKSNQENLNLSANTSRTARAKREVHEYYVDVLVALDYAFYQYWLHRADNDSEEAIRLAKEYVAYIFNEIDLRYNSISSSDYKLHMLLSGFLIAKTAEDSPWTEDVKVATSSGVYQVNAAAVLEALKAYVNNSYSSLPAHDHLMLITEYDLYGDDNGFRFNNTAGFAYVGTVCYRDGRSVSVVEDHGGFQSETTATHELGHSMGAKHDGVENDCNSDDRYVMSGGVHPVTSANKLNPWSFSNCSTAAFDKHITELLGNNDLRACLTDTIDSSDVPTVDGFPGQLAGPDEQCRQIYGPTSYLCRGSKFGAPEDICLSMYCRNPATASSCTLNTAAAGTCCGNQQWCIEGKCEAAPNASCYMSATCPFGQRQGVVYLNYTCDQLESGNCYNNDFRHVCCEMCDKAHTDVYGCEYGDKVRNCNATFCGRNVSGSNELYDVQCCGTCSHVPITLTPPPQRTTTVVVEVPDIVDTCRDTALVNGIEQCIVYLSREGLAYCCQAQVQDFCCRTCKAMKNLDDPTCPYGDCAICTALESRLKPCTEVQRSDCCSTCKELDQQLTTPSIPSTQVTTPTTAVVGTTAPEEEEEICKEIVGVVACGVLSLHSAGVHVLVLVGWACAGLWAWELNSCW